VARLIVGLVRAAHSRYEIDFLRETALTVSC